MTSKVEIDQLIAKGKIGDDDVPALRRAMYGDDHRISIEEATDLFRLNDTCDGGDVWSEFFIEAITDYLVTQADPRGYVDAQHSDWLVASISHSGVVKSATELELLVKVLEAAHEVPQELEMFALAQVKTAVLKGEGATRAGGALNSGQIGRTEVELLRRILYACGGGDSAAISRAEAEMLFDINDAVTDATNDASWPDLFVKAIANYLMAARGFQAPSREQALKREAWLDNAGSDVGGFFGKILAGGLRGILAAYQGDRETGFQAKAREIAVSEVITDDEAAWLTSRIGQDGKFDDAEKALLLFIKTESPDVHPSLKPLLEKVA